MATAEERSRLAQEMHDTVAQTLLGIVVQTSALELRLDPADELGYRMLAQIQDLARSGLDETRRAIRGLRPKPLDENSLPEALDQATRQLHGDDGPLCSFILRGTPTNLPAGIEDGLFRIAQEAMTNVRKHAGATTAQVTLEFHSNRVILLVRDHGAGLTKNRHPEMECGHGLAIMSDRALRIGGRLDIESPADGGVAIRVTVPVQKGSSRSRRPRPRTPASGRGCRAVAVRDSL